MKAAWLFALLVAFTCSSAFATSVEGPGEIIPVEPYSFDGDQPTNVAVFMNQLPWGYNTVVEVLTAYGISYTEDITFTPGLGNIPTIEDPTAKKIKARKAVLGANVTSDGGSDIIERGVVWSTSPNPTTTINEGMKIAQGTLGIFTVKATGFIGGKTYHYRGYAVSAVCTVYTDDATFTTKKK